MDYLKKIVDVLKESLGEDVNIKIVKLNSNKEVNENELKFETILQMLKIESPSENFTDELTNMLVTFENTIRDIKKYGKNPPETYIDDINEMLKDIIDYVTFYRDPNVLGCCYTKSVIAPKYLTDKDYEIYEPI